MKIEQIVSNEYKKELREAEQNINNASDLDKDIFLDMYISAKEYINATYQNEPKEYKEVLALSSANAEYFCYQNKRKNGN